MSRQIKIALIAAIACQMLVLIGMTVKASMPIWTGTQIKLRTIPVDPRSLFRGNYALLRYEISEIDRARLAETSNLRNGEKLYIGLKESKQGIYEFDSITLQPPPDGLYIRGRLQNSRWDQKSEILRIKYGIEAYFAPKDKALALEKELRAGGLASVSISSSGQAALVDIINPDTLKPFKKLE